MLKGHTKFKFWDFLCKGNWDAKIVLSPIKQGCNGRFFFFKENNFGNVTDGSM